MAPQKNDPKNDQKSDRTTGDRPAGLENYQVLARRFRPTAMAEVVGQESILESLRGALKSGEVPHAFLFSGSRGVGKTTLARILARCLNCQEGVSPEPCGSCSMCTSIMAGGNGDVREIDAASHNGVDDIRELRDRVGFASMGARYKVYILDEVHMLSRGAFNAFLKTLEEPPPNVVFILATTELHKVPDTIRSRCQVNLFQTLHEADITKRLAAIATAEGLTIADEIFLEIARAARGGMRDSETALERILPVAREKGADFSIEDYRRLMHRTGLDEVVDVVGKLIDGEAAPAMHFVAELTATGVDEREVLGEVLEVLRALLLLRVDGPDTGLVPYGGALRSRLQELAADVELVRLDAMAQAGLLGRERIRRVDDRRLVLELSMLRMAEAGRLPELAELLSQVRSQVHSQVHSGAPSAAAPAPSQRGAPPPQPSPRPAVPVATVGTLKEKLVATCRGRRGVLAPTLELCAVHGPDADDVVRVVVDTERKLHRDRMVARGVQDELRLMLGEILGKPVTVEVSLGEPAKPGKSEPKSAKQTTRAPQKRSGTNPGPAARKVLERFDGRIVDIASSTDSQADESSD
jgi:DNA polymerase III subunit gamma/tau